MVIMAPALTLAFTTSAPSAGVGNHDFITLAESEGVRDEWYDYVCSLLVGNYIFHGIGVAPRPTP